VVVAGRLLRMLVATFVPEGTPADTIIIPRQAWDRITNAVAYAR
jgi:hypothetical protein